MIYICSFFTVLLRICLGAGARDSSRLFLTVQEKQFARGGALLCLSRGASNEFDLNGCIGPKAEYKYKDTLLAHTVACQQLSDFGHQLCHNYMYPGKGIGPGDIGLLNPYKSGGGQIKDVEFTKHMVKVSTLLRQCRRDSKKQAFLNEPSGRGREIKRHWKTWIRRSDDWTEQVPEKWYVYDESGRQLEKMEITIQLKKVDAPERHEVFLKLARLMVIHRLSRGVMDFLMSPASPINLSVKNKWKRIPEAVAIASLGKTIAHVESQKEGLDLREYSLWFDELNRRLTIMFDAMDHTAIKYSNLQVQRDVDGTTVDVPVNPFGDALSLMDKLKTDPCFAKLRPTLFKNKEIFDEYKKRNSPVGFRWKFEEGWISRDRKN